MIEAKFNLGDEAVMMYDNTPIRAFERMPWYKRMFYKFK